MLIIQWKNKIVLIHVRFSNKKQFGDSRAKWGSRMSQWAANTAHSALSSGGHASSGVFHFSQRKSAPKRMISLRAASQQGFSSHFETSSLKSN